MITLIILFIEVWYIGAFLEGYIDKSEARILRAIKEAKRLEGER